MDAGGLTEQQHLDRARSPLHQHTEQPARLPPAVPTPGVLQTHAVADGAHHRPDPGHRHGLPARRARPSPPTGVVTAVYPTGGFNGYVHPDRGHRRRQPTRRPARRPTASSSTRRPPSATVIVGDAVTVTGYVVENSDADPDQRAPPAASTVTSLSVPLPPADHGAVAGDRRAREKIESMLYQPPGTLHRQRTRSPPTSSARSASPSARCRCCSRPMSPTPGSAEAAARSTPTTRRARVTLDDGASDRLPRSTQTDSRRRTSRSPSRSASAPTATFNDAGHRRLPQQRLEVPAAAAGDRARRRRRNRTTFSNTRIGNAAPDLVVARTRSTVASFNVLNYFTTLGT